MKWMRKVPVGVRVIRVFMIIPFQLRIDEGGLWQWRWLGISYIFQKALCGSWSSRYWTTKEEYKDMK